MGEKPEIDTEIANEKNRLRPAALEARRIHQKRIRQMQKLIERGTEEDINAAIKAAGLPADSPEALNALRIWRANRQL